MIKKSFVRSGIRTQDQRQKYSNSRQETKGCRVANNHAEPALSYVHYTSLFYHRLQSKFKSNRFFLAGITLSRGVTECSVFGEISDIPAEKKIPAITSIRL